MSKDHLEPLLSVHVPTGLPQLREFISERLEGLMGAKDRPSDVCNRLV